MTTLAAGPRITPFLWFDQNAEEAVDFYLGIFPNSHRIGGLATDGSDTAKPQPGKKVMTINFELEGQRFVALNGGPMFKFTEAVSFVVRCDDQQEIDSYWAKLSAGGSEGQCGWLKDKFGLSWQIVPSRLLELLRTPAAMQAMMGMKKLDIAALEKASQA